MRGLSVRKVILGVVAAAGSFIAGGAILDSISNAIALVNWRITIIGSIAIILLWFGLQGGLKNRPIEWHTYRVKRLGYYPACAFVGVILLLWTPPVLRQFKTSGREDKREVALAVTPIEPDTGKSDRTEILFADFQGPRPEEYGVTEVMFSHLEEAARPYSDVRVQRYDHPITTSEEARIVGTKHNSSIVIWGSYLVNRSNALVTAHFDILESSHYLFLQTATRRLRVKVPELEHFEVQETLSSEISYLALLAMGVARYQRGDHEGAIVRFNEALRHSKVATNFISPAYLHTFRADCYLQLDKYSEAIRDLNTAISAGFRESYIYETMALSYFVNRELSRALHAVNQAISIDSTPESGHCLRALILVYLAEPAQALEELATTITQHPESAYVHQIRALVYVLQGDGDHALNALNTAEHLGAQPNELNDTFAYAYASKQNYTKALEYINKAIASAPNEDYYVFRAVLLTGLERDENASDEEASSDLNKAIGINPSFGPAYEHRGLLNWKLGDIDKASADLGSAMSDLNNAISINPSYGPAYEHRGLLYWKLGDIDKASADLDTAIKVSPRIAGEYISRARLFAQKGIYESALRDLEMALRLEPMQVEAYSVRSRIFAEVGSLDRAKRDLTTILRISSDPEETDQARRQLDSLRDWNK